MRTGVGWGYVQIRAGAHGGQKHQILLLLESQLWFVKCEGHWGDGLLRLPKLTLLSCLPVLERVTAFISSLPASLRTVVLEITSGS